MRTCLDMSQFYGPNNEAGHLMPAHRVRDQLQRGIHPMSRDAMWQILSHVLSGESKVYIN